MADTELTVPATVNLPKVTTLAMFSRCHNEREQHMTITETHTPPIWPPTGCPKWCQFSDTPHTDDVLPGEKFHMGPDVTVDLILELDCFDQPKDATAYLYQHVDDGEVTIRFATGDFEHAVSLTLAEAAGIATNLLALCAEAES